MDYYVLNQSGRRVIQMLEKSGKNDEARILDMLDRAGSATPEQIAYSLHIDMYKVTDLLKTFLANRWIWRNPTKTSSF
jgi:DNA-binding MarR family transcriptional regulator